VNHTARCGALVLLVFSLVASPTAAQTPTDFGLSEGMKQVDEGEFDNAIVTLDTAARRLAADPKRVRELSQAYLYLGIAYVGKGHEAAAKAKFREALAGMKDLSLSAERFPPKVVDLFEAARADARAESPLPTSAAAPAPPAKKGGGKGLLVVGGLAVVGGGVALAAGGGGGGGSSPTTTTAAAQTLNRSGTVGGNGSEPIVVVASRAGSLEVTLTWSDGNHQLDIVCQENLPPYTNCGGTYNRTSNTSARYTSSVQQKEYLVVVNNYVNVNQSYTVVVRYP
jgi:hypothetical protein